jgi:hypothetical protein
LKNTGSCTYRIETTDLKVSLAARCLDPIDRQRTGEIKLSNTPNYNHRRTLIGTLYVIALNLHPCPKIYLQHKPVYYLERHMKSRLCLAARPISALFRLGVFITAHIERVGVLYAQDRLNMTVLNRVSHEQHFLLHEKLYQE